MYSYANGLNTAAVFSDICFLLFSPMYLAEGHTCTHFKLMGLLALSVTWPSMSRKGEQRDSLAGPAQLDSVPHGGGGIY